MEINNLEKKIEIENNLNKSEEQNKFLNSILGKTINVAIDIGLRSVLPDFLEDKIIELKNNLFHYGLKEGISKTINETIKEGKAAIGILTGDFQTISQMQSAVQAGGIIEGVSSMIDLAVDKASKAGVIKPNIATTVKTGKNAILNNVQNKIEKTFKTQLETLDNMNEAIDKWKKAFEEKEFEKMEIQYQSIQKQLKNLVPLENTLNQARTIENLHTLIKNNGKKFELKPEEIELAQKLV